MTSVESRPTVLTPDLGSLPFQSTSRSDRSGSGTSRRDEGSRKVPTMRGGGGPTKRTIRRGTHDWSTDPPLNSSSKKKRPTPGRDTVETPSLWLSVYRAEVKRKGDGTGVGPSRLTRGPVSRT